MTFIPNSEKKQQMLKTLKLKDIDELFSDIPKKIQITNLNLPTGISEQKVEHKLKDIAKQNTPFQQMPSFIGGGIKPHYIPAIVKSIILRPEFYTSYTPYQSEASQGFLQAMFEYQSMIAELTGMDIANASLYDGMTALGEAALMSSRINKKNKFIIPENISWEKKSILHNFVKGHDITIKEIPFEDASGKIALHALKEVLDESVSGVYIENPNFFGVFEDDVNAISKMTHELGSLFIVGVDPLSLGIVKSPSEYNADIVIGESRVFGNPMDFGGSSLGLFACKKEFLRQIPGRVIGLTKDCNDKQSYCMTLQTREQHIRRGRATSNICTNEGLCTLAATVYLSWLGGSGFQKLSQINYNQGEKLGGKIANINGFSLRFTSSNFNEFVVQCPKPGKIINEALLKADIIGGLSLDKWFPKLKNCMLFGITEMHTEEDINKLVDGLKEVA